jgi:hypothetical protein
MNFIQVLAFIFLLSDSIMAQVSIDFNELKSVTNKNDFIKVVLANDFEMVNDTENKVTLAYGFDDVDSSAKVWAYYYQSTESFGFIIYDVGYYDNTQNQTGLYQHLLKDIKKCNYVKIFKHGFNYDENALTYLLYSCPTSKYKGLIGFSLITENGKKVGRIRTFTSDEIKFYEYVPEED